MTKVRINCGSGSFDNNFFCVFYFKLGYLRTCFYGFAISYSQYLTKKVLISDLKVERLHLLQRLVNSTA